MNTETNLTAPRTRRRALLTAPRTRRRALLVSEIFGPTFQGEGPSVGRPAVFLRLAGCNLDCSWCDTPYSWDWARYDRAAETESFEPPVVAHHLQTTGLRYGEPHPLLLVVTGGEPLLQHIALDLLLAELPGLDVEIETNGTRPPDLTFPVEYNVSPKLANSGIERPRRIKPAILRQFAERQARFKFVVTAPADLDEVDAICDDIAVMPENVWIMPEGATTARLLSTTTPALAEAVLARGWNLTPRLQVTLWEGQRGH